MEQVIKFVLGRYLNFINRISNKIGGKHAFYVFCFGIPIKLKPHQNKFLTTAQNFNLDFEGKKIACYQWGNGPKKLLCVHGWQSHSYRWKKYIESLAYDQYTILAIDAPSNGNSEGKILNVPMYARLLKDVILEYNIDYLLAHSLGAFSCFNLLHENPDIKIKKIASLASPGKAMDFVNYLKAELKLNDKVIKNLRDYFIIYAKHEPEYYSIEEFMPSIESAGLVIHDQEDKEVDVNYAKRINQLWSNSELVLTSGLGHKLRSLDVVNKVKYFFDND